MTTTPTKRRSTGRKKQMKVVQQTLLSREDLAGRWNVSKRALESWNAKGIGPTPIHLGAYVRYRLEDVERIEQEGITLGRTCIGSGSGGRKKVTR